SEAAEELRQVYDEKFSRMDEKFGSINEQILTSEKEVEKLEIMATKASDLVAEVQPESILSEARKAENKVEIVKSKIEAFENIHEAIFEELKDVKRTVKLFRGTEELAKMNKDILKDQVALKRMQSNVEKHADKIESIYTDVLKSFDDYSNYKQMFKGVQEDFYGIRREFDSKLPRIENSASKQDILELKEMINKVDVKMSEKILAAVKDFELFKEDVKSNFHSAKKDVGELKLSMMKNTKQIMKNLETNTKTLTRYEEALKNHVHVRNFERLDKSFTHLKNDSAKKFDIIKDIVKVVRHHEKKLSKLD
ncbi:hypothetical protein BVX95_01715, partial [archaeon D22]